MATEKQLQYVKALAKRANVQIDPSEVKQMDVKKTSSFIEDLQAKLRNGRPSNNGQRPFDPVRFGLSSKLVNERWTSKQKSPLHFEQAFIKEVEQTYNLLQRAEGVFSPA
ncbi:MAG TPA: hypothetical protein PLN69_05540 [bacterium]|nr:hypothetical protein [bacterium]